MMVSAAVLRQAQPTLAATHSVSASALQWQQPILKASRGACRLRSPFRSGGLDAMPGPAPSLTTLCSHGVDDTLGSAAAAAEISGSTRDLGNSAAWTAAVNSRVGRSVSPNAPACSSSAVPPIMPPASTLGEEARLPRTAALPPPPSHPPPAVRTVANNAANSCGESNEFFAAVPTSKTTSPSTTLGSSGECGASTKANGRVAVLAAPVANDAAYFCGDANGLCAAVPTSKTISQPSTAGSSGECGTLRRAHGKVAASAARSKTPRRGCSACEASAELEGLWRSASALPGKTASALPGFVTPPARSRMTQRSISAGRERKASGPRTSLGGAPPPVYRRTPGSAAGHPESQARHVSVHGRGGQSDAVAGTVQSINKVAQSSPLSRSRSASLSRRQAGNCAPSPLVAKLCATASRLKSSESPTPLPVAGTPRRQGPAVVSTNQLRLPQRPPPYMLLDGVNVRLCEMLLRLCLVAWREQHRSQSLAVRSRGIAETRWKQGDLEKQKKEFLLATAADEAEPEVEEASAGDESPTPDESTDAPTTCQSLEQEEDVCLLKRRIPRFYTLGPVDIKERDW
eukprot:gnl/TRDRNA2_/TRDRNA2_85104_c0_seq1.p1 gnl/TRDRNA2_/TRDRNA2_85104_c0~~gnl/TRDRNA2_/TRDRNA2_85104_c0_seq1.p1  ORF type:complete len:573 (-),score=71.02 gnl/TRDRNA2_/TRDRNA2_85104_c0_seq1:54-1772(-)